MTAGQTVAQDIAVVAGQKVKVVVCLEQPDVGDQHLDADRSTGGGSRPAHRPARRIGPSARTRSTTTTSGSSSRPAAPAQRASRSAQTRFESSSERYGLAWAKWSIGTPIRVAGSRSLRDGGGGERATVATGVPVAYVATGLNYPDALAAGAAAGIAGGPVLLTDAGTCRRSTRRRARPGSGPAGSWCSAAPGPCRRRRRNSSRPVRDGHRGSRGPIATRRPWR